MSFPLVSPKQSFPALESEVLAYWKANNTFQKSIDSRPEDNPYRFYDGPPFITGMPHYGSLLSSIVKDVVGRYWTMQGRRVDRTWGWDCHGLPIEEKVQKKLGLKSNKEIEENGVKKFIDECYNYTRDVSSEWNWYIDKIGRWVDMDNAYRTMDQDYMESVMWVFSELWKKGLIYEGKRVSLYSWKLGTPISNFEVAMDDTYQEVNDPAITVKFAIEQDTNYIDKKEGGKFEYTPEGLLRYVLAVMKNEKGEYLMLKNIKHGEKWQCPGGKIDAGETAEQALKREVMEELGVDCTVGAKITEKRTLVDGTMWQGEYYEVTLMGTPIIQEPHKHIKMEWVGLTKGESGYILQSETEQSVDQNFIRENFDLWNLVTDRPNIGTISILAWTTTPWTIPANMALAVRNNIDYILVENNGEGYIVAKNRLETVFKGKGEYTVIREFKGSELVGLSYIPPFPEYYHNKFRGNSPLIKGDVTEGQGDLASEKIPPTPFIKGEPNKNHKVYHADFITDTDGTGIGHEAPEFGEVDFQLAKKEGIYISNAMDEAGKYTDEIFDYAGTHYLDLENPEKGANKINIERMKANNTLFKLEGITHRVPFCPRSGTPLVQKAQASWFIDIQSQKDKLIEANEQINWFPEYLKEGRFKKGIETAPDWCISRTRYWGAPMPVWMGEDGEKMVVSSRDEIFEANKPYGQLTKLIITRHAESEANVARHYDDIGNSPLSELGHEQAELLMKNLMDQGVDVIITSPFLRAIQTAEPLAKSLGIEIITDNRLKETDHGKYANADYNNEDTKKLIHEQRKQMFEDKSMKFGEIGDSYSDVESRVQGVIEDVCEKYPGKTVFIVSHGFPVRIATEYLTEKRASETTKNADMRTFILDVANKNLLNLHKPYIDSILLQNPQAKEAKKVLGIHGWTSRGLGSGEEGFWTYMKETLNKNNISLEVPDFDKNQDTKYSNWKEKLDTLKVSEFDTVVAHSFGCPVSIQYIIENQIRLNRLVLIAPSGMIGNKYLEKIIPEITADVTELKKYVSEVVIIHSEDDGSDSAKFAYGKSLAEKVGVKFIGVNGYNHDFRNNGKTILTGLVQYGSPMTRIPEVLDVWMDSGSMPYAQMHYPFENKEAMQASFPADFIAEYVGQIRAWFYVMHVLGVLVNPNNNPKPTPSFTNVITTGVVNGNDGRKMSKSFGNYPDPRMAIEKYGADPIRFYMLNSPLLSGGDMDFKEEGIMETIKGVMLPIWNTYSFFTTYANIDKWEADTTEVWFSRHAESTSNVESKMSDGSDNPHITEKGKEQAKNAGKTLASQGKNFDVIIHTDRIRTYDTARIIGEEIGFSGEYIIDDGFAEQTAGEYANKTLAEIAEMGNLPKDASHMELRKLYKNNSVENIEQFEKRILGAYENILAKHKGKGKRILIVAHAGTPRPILHKYMGMNMEQAYYDTSIANADPFRLMTTQIINPLDSWILSKLQVLIGQVHDAMEGYDISRGCRAITDYMDELTNWYVRLSRRRFWESGMTADKQSAYETLYTVLTETSKLLAPLMPFLSENIWKGLTDGTPLIKGDVMKGQGDFAPETNPPNPLYQGGMDSNSVHLEYITRPNKHLVANDLNRDMDICEHIVSLGLALRSRKNIRVRQPLASVTITRELSEYYMTIIRDELNVKIVKFENPEKLAKKICKPDARKIGPKYGKDVQKVITEAKNGNFVEKENGIIDVGGFILEPGEYTMEYLPLEGTLDVEGGYGMVVGLDTTITDTLKLEGFARDIVRAIQDMRKEADYQVTDRVQISLSGGVSIDVLSNWKGYIEKETLSTIHDSLSDSDLEKIITDEEMGEVQLNIKK